MVDHLNILIARTEVIGLVVFILALLAVLAFVESLIHGSHPIEGLGALRSEGVKNGAAGEEASVA